MIKAGELTQFIKDLIDKLGPRNDRENGAEDRERCRGKVKTIFGGSVLDRDSKNTRKRYALLVYNLY